MVAIPLPRAILQGKQPCYYLTASFIGEKVLMMCWVTYGSALYFRNGDSILISVIVAVHVGRAFDEDNCHAKPGEGSG